MNAPALVSVAAEMAVLLRWPEISTVSHSLLLAEDTEMPVK
ncbi:MULTISPECIES: hypothetical protein [Streptomyces]|nr:hypothetical protein [Streptomyces niger]